MPQSEYVLAEQYHCKPVLATVPYRWPLALDLLKRQYDALFSGHFMETVTEAFCIAPTTKFELFGATGYLTTDPENVKTVLTTRFKDYGLGSRRLAAMPFLGEGIFGQDGPAYVFHLRTSYPPLSGLPP